MRYGEPTGFVIDECVPYCVDCAEKIADERGESTDDYPAFFGESETDCPTHCDECGELIEETLTSDGEEYVRAAFKEFYKTGRGRIDVLQAWSECFDIPMVDMASAVDQAELVELLRDVRDEARTFDPDEIADEDGNPSIDVRLQLFDDGEWSIHTGLSDYDTDHHGYWGASSVRPEYTDEDLVSIADDMISRALESYWA